MHIIGIDPGMKGAIGSIVDGKYHAVHDIPVADNGSKGNFKNWLDCAAYYAILKEIVADRKAKHLTEHAVLVMIEKPIPMPGQMIQSAASSFDTFGGLRALPLAMGYRVEYVIPVVWKRKFGLTEFPKGYTDSQVKRASIDRALRFFPLADISLAKHDGRAEALLVAQYAWQQFGQMRR